MGRQDDSPEHQTLSGRGGRAPDAVRTHRAKRSMPGWRQDSGWKHRQIRTQRRIDVGPNSRLTFYASGASDAQDTQDASYFFC